LPLLIGGGGEKVTLRIAARYADEWNTWGSPETLRHKMEVLDQHCAAIGRDAKTIRRSAQALFTVRDEVGGPPPAGGFPAFAGTVDELRDVVRQYAEAGVDELIVPDRPLGRGEQRIRAMDRFINDVAAEFRDGR